MSYRYILVHMGHATDLRRVTTAAALARAHGAHLIGRLYMEEPRQPGPGAAHAPAPPRTATFTGQASAAGNPAARERSAGDEQERIAQHAQSTFEQAIRKAGVEGSFEARPTRDRPLWDCVLEDARCADLTVVAKPDGEAATKRLPGHLVAESGGPVLVVPDSAEGCPGERHVAVAWNGAREAARAVRDAMPLIEAAGRVTLLLAKPKAEAEASAPRLQAMLAHHGATVDVKREKGDMRAADILVSRAEEIEADVMVMGAFGRARLREVFTGGATTARILDQTTMPLLLAQ